MDVDVLNLHSSLDGFLTKSWIVGHLWEKGNLHSSLDGFLTSITSHCVIALTNLHSSLDGFLTKNHQQTDPEI